MRPSASTFLDQCKLDPIQTRRILEDDIKYRVERVPGVAAFDIWGGLEREIHVDLDPDKLIALQISLNQVINRIRTANITLPAGTIEAGNYEIALRTPGEYTSLGRKYKSFRLKIMEISKLVNSQD